MFRIAILSASVREGRSSHRVALFLETFIREENFGTVDIIDLLQYNFPVFSERLKYQKNVTPDVREFADKIINADAVIIVTPEYNGGYPASLKNVIDLLYQEWYKMPVGVVTISDGVFGGSQVITSLVFTLWKIKAWVIPAQFPVPEVNESFSAEGVPSDPVSVKKRANVFVKELLWCVEARRRMAST
jgi:NAD(P)H-dependent FMN reductase